MQRHLFFKTCVLICLGPLAWACGDDDSRDSLNPAVPPPSASLAANFANWVSAYPDPGRDESFVANHVWMERIHLKAALSELTDKVQSEPIIAVLDSGVDYEHPALKHRIVDTSGLPSRCRDHHHGCNTANYKYPDQELGHGAVHPLGTAEAGAPCSFDSFEGDAKCLHGTHVAGIIAGYQPEADIFGICPSCRILPVRIVNDAGAITDDAIYAAFEYIAELMRAGLPIRIVNASFGKYQSSDRVNKALTMLSKTSGDVLFVAAAGNENSWMESFPAAHPSVISVANVNSSNLQKDGRSNYGPSVDIAAPVGLCGDMTSGFGIVSAAPAGFAECANGTSMAAPMVAAVAGLLLTAEPHLSAADLKARLLATADREGLYAANPSYLLDHDGRTWPMLGAGLLQAAAAVKNQAVNPPPARSDRVNASCGVVGSAGATTGWWLLLLPLLAGLQRLRLRKGRDA